MGPRTHCSSLPVLATILRGLLGRFSLSKLTRSELKPKNAPEPRFCLHSGFLFLHSSWVKAYRHRGGILCRGPSVARWKLTFRLSDCGFRWGGPVFVGSGFEEGMEG
jgi:hypothetical protein